MVLQPQRLLDVLRSETQHLTVLAQILTAMCVEGLRGTADSFNAFISQVRPHNGQLEVSNNIRKFLQGSQLARGVGDLLMGKVTGLFQDRYALRSAVQWLSPQLEDLRLAEHQMGVEINSTTDNPLLNVPNEKVHFGANLQAASVSFGP